MVIIDEADFIGKPVGGFCKFGLVYVAQGSPEFMVMGGKWPGDKETQWVKDYFPQETMLVGITRNDGGVSSYKIEGRGDGTPLLCYERAKGPNN